VSRELLLRISCGRLARACESEVIPGDNAMNG
jgi:hypothetical protein